MLCLSQDTETRFFMWVGKNKPKVAFIHGRPSGHPIHAAYARALGADFFHEDRLLRWQDIKGASKIRRYLSWFLNALFFPEKYKYDAFFCECMRVPQLIMKKLGLIKRNQKLIALMADESLYFLDKKQFPFLTRWLIKEFLNSCDAIICIGDLQYELALKYCNDENKIFKIYNGLDEKQILVLNKVSPKLDIVYNLMVIGNMAAYWRAWYKGLDLAIDALVEINSPNLNLIIVGDIKDEVKNELLKGVPVKLTNQIKFTGNLNDITQILKDIQLCIHCSRGDAFPTSTLECFVAGIPVIVSEDTGTKSFVSDVDKNLVCLPTVDSLTNAIQYYLNSSALKRNEISSSLKKHPNIIESSKAIDYFVSVFNSIIFK